MNSSIRAQFPITERYIYLNSAAVSPPPLAAAAAINRQLDDVIGHGSSHYTDWVATKERCRVLLSSMLGCRPEQVAFTRNTSDGFASIAAGIRWNAGDNIVSFAGEFPANFYPWRSVRDRHGVDLRLAAEVDGRVDIEQLIAMIDERTRVVALSVVQFSSGFRADLERVGNAAHAVGALFSVDTIQGIGAFGLDLSQLPVDAACGASHKWLCGPEGCGYIYLADRGREMIDPALIGWISVDDPWDFADREQAFRPNALAWESGTGPSSLFYGLEESLKTLNNVGLDNIEQHLAGLSSMIVELVDAEKFDLVSSRAAGEASAIVCFLPKGGRTSSEIASALFKRNVVVSPRGERLRIAPHFYNVESEIEEFARILNELG